MSHLYNVQNTPIAIGGHEGHVHIVAELSPDFSVDRLVKEIQKSSADFIEREQSSFADFKGWDSEFVSISYHPSQVESLKDKIAGQFDYHRTVSFEEELCELLNQDSTAAE